MDAPDTTLIATAHEHELTIGYMGRTWHLFAWPLDDFPLWDAAAVDESVGGPTIPAIEWGVADEFNDPWSALVALAGAIIRKAVQDGQA